MPTPHQIAQEFIAYLKKEKLIEQLPALIKELTAEAERNQDITITSAAPLSEREQAEFRRQLSKKWGEHRLLFTVDPILLSGAIISFKDQLIDLSGRGALADLSQNLK